MDHARHSDTELTRRREADATRGEVVGARDGLSRRLFLCRGAGALVLTPLAGAALLQAACGPSDDGGGTAGTRSGGGTQSGGAGGGASGSGAQKSAGGSAAQAPKASGSAGSGEPSTPAAGTPRAGGAGGSDATRLVTEVPAMASLVEQLQYTNESPKPDQSCANCLFYTARTEDRGKCQLFPQGLVAAGGWCTSWTAKS